jgi:hypothetical protein
MGWSYGVRDTNPLFYDGTWPEQEGKETEER